MSTPTKRILPNKHQLTKAVFPDKVRRAFVKLGNDQRGKPERLMLDIQFLYGGGVLNPVVEHGGDLTHRMTHLVKYTPEDRLPTNGELGYWMVEEKVHKILYFLQYPYGFEKEMKENLQINYEYKKEKQPNLTYKEYVDKIDLVLYRYAQAHSDLTVYNIAQYRAQQVAVSIGLKKWFRAEQNLIWLKNLCKNKEKYIKECSSFSLDSSGNPIPYT